MSRLCVYGIHIKVFNNNTRTCKNDYNYCQDKCNDDRLAGLPCNKT